VGPKRVTIEYTTQGGLDEAVRLWEGTMGMNPETEGQSAAGRAGRNWDYFQEKLAESPDYRTADSYHWEERPGGRTHQEAADSWNANEDEDRARYQAEVEGHTKASYQAKSYTRAVKTAEEAKAAAKERGRPTQGGVTSKAQPKEDVAS
jgi:hypothetical protein